MRAYKKPLSVVMAVLMLIGMIAQVGLETITVKAANMKTHCIAFTDTDGSGMTGVTVQYAIAVNEPVANSSDWKLATDRGDGRYDYSFDFDEIVNDQTKRLYIHWDTNNRPVAPVNGKKSSFTYFLSYTDLSSRYNNSNSGNMWWQGNSYRYDDWGSYSARFVDISTDFSNNTINFNYYDNPAKWAVILYKIDDINNNNIFPSDFSLYGLGNIKPGKDTLTIKNNTISYYLFYSDDSSASAYSSYFDRTGFLKVNYDILITSVINHNDTDGSWGLAAYPIASDGTVLENSGTTFTYPNNNGGNSNPGGNNNSNPAITSPYPKGLELCFMFSAESGQFNPDSTNPTEPIHWDQEWSTQSQRTGGFPFIARLNINGTLTPINDTDASNFSADKSMQITTNNETVSDGTYTYKVYYWTTPQPDWYTLTYTTSTNDTYKKWIEIESGNSNQNDSTGLKAVWGLGSYNNYSLGENPWWDGPNAWQPINCTEFYFVLKYVDSDNNTKHLTRDDLKDIGVKSASEINTMVITDSGYKSAEDGYTVFKWEIPKDLDTYTISYNGDNLVVDIRYNTVALYNSTTQSITNCIGNVSFQDNKTVNLLFDTITSSDKYTIKAVNIEYDNPNYDANDPNSAECISEDILSQQESTFVKSWSVITNSNNEIIGYTINFKDEWPTSLDNEDGFYIKAIYRDQYSTDDCDNYSWINRYGNSGGGQGSTTDYLWFTNNFGNNSDGSISLPDGICCGTYRQSYKWGRECDFVFQLNTENGVSALTAADLILPNGITITSTGESVEYDNITYQIYHLSFADCVADYVIGVKNSDAKIDLHILYPDIAFYSDNEISIDNLYIGEATGLYGQIIEPSVALYKPGQSLYVIANLEENCVIDKVEAYCWDSSIRDFAVVNDASALFDIVYEYTTVNGKQYISSAKITYKNSWPMTINGKSLQEYKIIAHGIHLDSDGTLLENSSIDEDIYVDNFFMGCDAVLDDNINMYFYCSLDDTHCFSSNTKVIIDYGTGRYVYDYNEFSNYYMYEGLRNNVYKFPCELAAAQMTQDIKLSIEYKGEELASYTVNFLQFAKAIKSRPSNSEEMVELIDSLLNYGSYAQQYFNTNTQKPSNEGMYDEGENPVDKLSSETVKTEIEKLYKDRGVLGTPIEDNNLVELFGTSLTCKDKVSFNVYLTVKNGYNASDLSVTSIYNNIVGAAVTNSVYKVTIQEINACNLDGVYEFTVEGEDGEAVTITVTPFTYIYEAQNSNNDKLIDLTKSIYLYQQAARKYTMKIDLDDNETEIQK